MFAFKRTISLKQLISESRSSLHKCRHLSTIKQTASASVASDLTLTSQSIETIDPEIYNIIESEKVRERECISLSPASNYASKPVLDTLQTVLQNKYSEGYPHARYYGGNENVDNAEELTRKRALQLFNLNPSEWKVNVQPLGNYNALFAVLTALIPRSSRIMAPIHNNLNGIRKFYNILSYSQENIHDLAHNYKPNMIISGNGVDAAFNGTFNYESIYNICTSLQCAHVVDISDIAGLIVANAAVSPFAFADVVICSPFATLRGPRGAAMIFYRHAYASSIDSAVFPGHQGGPHNHAISAMATSLKMAQSEEFIGYQQRVIENAKTMENVLKDKQWENVDIIGNNGHCVAVKGSDNIDMELLYNVGNRVNVEMLYDGDCNEVRVSSNAMTTRGLSVDDFSEVVDILDDVKRLAQDVKQNGSDKCEAKINSLKSEVSSFAKQFPLIGID